ncbi:fungal-specific transcription factor domain-containing protein [Xylariaceae sp. FL0662B]|nr:fungal-specific transcription factor domain-containing protein [Xylariaceae sp. FL0662B]
MSQYPPPNSGPTRGSYGMMPNQYQPPQQGYPTTSSMMPQTSVAASHPQPIAPAPAAARPPVLRPMPAGGVMPQTGLPSPYGGSPMMPHQQSLIQDSDQPTHVVGSQGRRGILPSAPGRPAAPTGSGASKNTVIPQKDADGKFPCPHCTKTYLHAKHLKRHLLRHTGDRPYMCVLCRDTFSRSDILKRHFQKCSIRRGNPTGASHLSHPQAHVKKQQQNAQKAEGDMGHMNGMNNMPGDGVVHPFGMVQIQDGMGNMANDQNQLSRSSSMSRMDDNSNRDRRSMTGGYNGDVSNSMSSNINPQLANFNMPPSQNGMPMYGASGSNQQSGLDWAQMFPQPGAQQHTYVNQFPPNVGQNQTAIKTDPNVAPERPNGMPGAAPNDVHNRSLFFSHWELPPSAQDHYQQLSSQILSFFYPPGTVYTNQTDGMQSFFSPANVRDFLDAYSHFHVHFSFLHIPTFRIMEAYTGLIAAMCCIGACYSNRVASPHVKETMNFLKIALERDCNLFGSNGAQTAFRFENGGDKRDIERLQALILLTGLLIWNGTPIQRESAQRLFPLVADIARKFNLLQVRSGSPAYSILHQPNLALQTVNPGHFDWAAWIEQEMRIRLMYMIYLFDVTRGLYFNYDPQFDSFEIHLPLPSDDAAWEAESAVECAQALNLYGPDAAKAKNPDGSQRSKQPELDLALRALLHGSYQIHPGSTNLYGKFIMIHALLAQIRRAQVEGSLIALEGPGAPLSQNDWVITEGSETGSGNVSANNSRRGTPVAGMSASTYKTISRALDKFKSYWDMDMAIQFPPSVSNPRRYGFSRDGIHFFWLAKWMIKNPSLADFQSLPDNRFRQVIQLLKSAKAWVVSDGVSRGEELGSVGDIDNEFGVANLTLDMAQVFKPLPSVVESPDMPTVKAEF